MLLMIVAKTVLALASFQDPAPQTPGPWMWTLDRQGDAEAFEKVGLPRPDEKRAADYAALLRARLKSLVTRTEVQRNFGESFIWLDYLRIGACWSVDYPGKAEIAAEIAATRADWLEKLGKHKEAVFAAWHPFVMPEENSGNMVIACWHWNASNGSLAELVNKTDALPAMIELHKRFPSDAPATKGGDAIEEVVRNSILYGDPQTLKDFGARCVPALQKALLDGPDELPSRLNPISDPLSVLLAIDRRSAENLILSTLGQRGPTWTQRVLRALSNTGMTGGSWVNSTDPLQPPRFDDPLTLQLIDALAAQPMSSISLFALLAPLVSNDVISPAVQSFLLGHLQSTDPQIVELLHGMLDGARCGPNKRALYEAFLDSASPLLRSSCARALQHYSVGPATLRATQHSDPNVRSDALVALLRHYEFPFRYWGTPPPAERIERAVPRTPEIEAALLRLAHDGETGVRLALVNALRGAKEAPPAALLDALLSDADAGVRATACWGWDFDAALQSRALERLAGDPAPEVITAVINTLWNRSPGRNPENATEFERYLPALSKLLANAQLVVKDNHPLANLFQGALMGGGGPRAVFDVCMHGPRSAEFGPLLLDSVRWRSNNPGEVPIQRVLDAPAVAEIFALACVRLDPNPFDWLAQSVRSSIDSGELDAAPILALTRDPARPRIVRLRALRVAVSKAGSADAQAYLELLRGIKAEEVDPEKQETRPTFLLALTNGWPAAALAGFSKRVLTDPGVPDMLALRVAADALSTTQEKLDAEGTGAAVERWMRLDSGEMWEASSILRELDPGVDARVLVIWRAEAKELRWAMPLLDALQAFPVDESIDILIEIITRNDVAIDSGHRARAADLLARRLDDRGADALLRAIAAAPFESVRQKCFDGLEQIRKYQDEKQSWQKRKGGEAARDQAIADLLPMLGDKEATIRAAAARSLATLQATEHLPKLVALLKDKDASVREAAQKALDALNAPGKKP